MNGAVVAITAFNLLCSGTHTMGEKRTEETITFRVDLANRTFCMDTCASTFAIDKVEHARIVFLEGTDRETGLDNYLRVNRINGQYIWQVAGRFAGQNMTGITIGECKREPFTGFPKQRF